MNIDLHRHVFRTICQVTDGDWMMVVVACECGEEEEYEVEVPVLSGTTEQEIEESNLEFESFHFELRPYDEEDIPF